MSMDYILTVGVIVISCWVYFWRRLKRENSMPTFHVSEKGIEVIFSSIQDTQYYSWKSVVSVELISPFDRGSKGLLEEHEGRPGYELSFSDGTKVMVYQRIEGYFDFYQILASHNIQGVKNKLPYYDRLNIYGQSIDGSKWFLNDGKPVYIKDVVIDNSPNKSIKSDV